VNRTSQNDFIYTTGSNIRETTHVDTTNYPSNGARMLIGAISGADGTGTTTGQFLDGNVAEIVSYSNPYDMTNETRQRIEGYLAWKWNLVGLLPTDHLYKNAKP
jgi:hypothetical protein